MPEVRPGRVRERLGMAHCLTRQGRAGFLRGSRPLYVSEDSSKKVLDRRYLVPHNKDMTNRTTAPAATDDLSDADHVALTAMMRERTLLDTGWELRWTDDGLGEYYPVRQYA